MSMQYSDNDPRNDVLSALFAQYKAAFPDPEASANFMPELWRSIESRQNVLLRMKRLTQVFVATAAAICLVFAVLSLPKSSSTELRGSYVEVLAEFHPTENLAALGIVPHDGLEANRK
jgi:hypothetical protein